MIRPLIDCDLEEKVVNLVIRARQEQEIPEQCYGWKACELLGLTRERQILSPGQEGMLTGDGRVIVSTQTRHIARIEYTTFHELVHHLIEEDGELYEHLHEMHHDCEKSFNATLERWCQVGAAEFMMPRARVRAMIAEHGFCVDLIERIGQINCASEHASSIQLAVCAPVDCYVVLCAFGPSSAWPHTPALYVEQATKRDDWEFPLVQGTVIPVDHLFHRVWVTKKHLSGPSYIPFRSGKVFPCVHADAKMLGSRVAGILCLDQPPADLSEPSLFEG